MSEPERSAVVTQVLLDVRLARSIADAVLPIVEDLCQQGLVRRVGAASQLVLTDQGRSRGEALLTAELLSAGATADVTAAYEKFLAINGPFLAVCSDWQLRPEPPGGGDQAPGARVRNDHSDAAWDHEVLDRLEPLHAQVSVICDDLTACLERFGGYRARLSHALGRVRRGDPGWFARPLYDSYHSVWFELHENLLATLGIDRHREQRPLT